MPVDLACTACGATLRVPRKLIAAGKPVVCPKCTSPIEDGALAFATPARPGRPSDKVKQVECAMCLPGSSTRALLEGVVGICPRCGRSFHEDTAAYAQWDSPERARAKTEVLAEALPAPAASASHADQEISDEHPSADEVVEVGEPVQRSWFLGRIAQLNLPARTAFFLGCWALFLASVPPLSVLSKPLSGLGVLLGLAGLVPKVWRRQGAVLLPTAICALCLLDLLFAGSWPKRRGSAAALATPPLLFSLAAPAAEGRPFRAEDWALANTDIIQQQDLRLLVSSVRIEVLPSADPSVPAAVPTKLLFIEVRMAYASRDPLQALVYMPWSDQVHAPSRNPPLLTDQLQRPYTQVPRDPARPLPQVRRPETLLTAGSEIGDVLVYPAPPADVEFLQLELPGAAFSLPGQFRFRIPRDMIQVP